MEGASRPATGYPVPPSHPPNGQHFHQPPPGTAYPYQAPPPAQSTNPYYYNNQAYPNPRATFLRRIVAALILVTVVFFTILFIIWLVVRPRLPQFQVITFSVSDFNVSTSSQRLTGNWNARFQVYNPNKKLKVYYYEIRSQVLYGTEVLSDTRIQPFNQDTKNQTVVDAAYSAIDTYVDDWVVTGIGKDRGRGAVGFNLRVVADVGFKMGGVRTRRRFLRVRCDDVAVGVSANSGSGNLTGGARKCSSYA